MAFRSVLIEKATRINLDLNHVIIACGEDTYSLFLDEISILVISDPRAYVSLRLLETLLERGITVLFTNSSHMPIGELSSMCLHSRGVKRLKQQLTWSQDSISYLWTEIVRHKIQNQRDVLDNLKKWDKLDKINQLLKTLEENDPTNHEGIVSRIYFRELFGSSFRRFQEDLPNACLNFIYQVLRSKISQVIVCQGYHPSLGIHHYNEFNNYNLADDLIEVFRPILDYYVFLLLAEEKESVSFLTPLWKEKLLDIVNRRVLYKGKEYKIHTVAEFFLQDIFRFLATGDISVLDFPKLICIL